MQMQMYKQQISKDQSHSLIHELISVSIYCLTFIRNIFEEENYIDNKYYSCESPYPYDKNYITTKKLIKGITTEADSLINCIEIGIRSALESEYLKAIQFSIHSGDQTIESYVFGIYYENQSVSLQRNNKENFFSERNNKDKSFPDVSEVMQSIQSLIKRLLVLTQVFDSLPNQKYISLRLTYHDTCPIEYQPPFFQDCSDPLLIHVDKSKKVIEIGNVRTGRNNVNLNVFVKGTSSSTVTIDPFDTLHSEDNFAVEPHPLSSLNLDKYLDINGTHVEDTHLVTNNTSQESIFSHQEDITTITVVESGPICTKCKSSFNPVAYGYNKPLKKNITCTKCVFNGSITWELSWLMNVRLLWNHLQTHEITTFEDLVNSLEQPHEKLIIAVFNRLFMDKVLVSTNSAILGSNTEYSCGSGVIIPSISGIIANDGRQLIKGRSYYISFVPKLQKKYSYMTYDRIVEDIYFPNLTLNRAKSVMTNLERFLALPRVNLEMTTPPAQVDTNITVDEELQISDNLQDLAFQDSLVFLSQSQMNKPKRIQEQLHINTKRRKISMGRI